MNIEKGLSKVVSPVSNVLKRNNKIINTALIVLLALTLFPVEYFLKSDPVKETETKVAEMLANPIVMVVVIFFLYAIYESNDVTMFTLYMYLLHRLLHNSSGGSPSPSPSGGSPSPSPSGGSPSPPPAPKKTPPPPAPKKTPPPPAPKKTPPPPAPKKTPPTPKKTPPVPKKTPPPPGP